MTETNQTHPDASEQAGEPTPSPGPVVTTGHPEVDSVLRSLDGLDGAPLAEHVAVFESAHERLRTVLSDAGRADQG